MEIQSLLKSPYKLKIFFSLLILILIFLLIANFILLPYLFNGAVPLWDKVISDIINNLTTVVVSAIATASFLYFITPKVMNKSDITIVSPHDLKHTLNNITNNTESFIYYGHTARWSRSVTLPKLIKESNMEHITKNIEIIIIDPNNAETVKYYAKFGHGERLKGRRIVNPKDVKTELFTTILAMYEYQKNPFIDITIYLSSNVSLFRMDLTQNALILTKPYSEEPALLFYKESFFYKSYKEEIKIAKEQSVRLSLNEFENKPLNNVTYGQILKDLGFENIEFLNDEIDSILNNIKKPISPF